MRAADPSPTPPLHVTLRLRGPPTNSSSTPSNGGDSRGRLAAVTGVAGAATTSNNEAPLIIIGSTAHVSGAVWFGGQVRLCVRV
jgi:membrane peptidoglycan carboxypeptidase